MSQTAEEGWHSCCNFGWEPDRFLPEETQHVSKWYSRFCKFSASCRTRWRILHPPI